MSSSSISCESNVDGEGKQEIQEYHFNFPFGGAKWTPTFKTKWGPYCNNCNVKTKCKKTTIINPT
jgi:hypothetical protein